MYSALSPQKPSAKAIAVTPKPATSMVPSASMKNMVRADPSLLPQSRIALQSQLTGSKPEFVIPKTPMKNDDTKS